MELKLPHPVMIWLTIALFGVVVFSLKPADAAEEPHCAGESTSTTTAEARKLIKELRRELADVEEQIRRHPYLTALERKQVSQNNLKAFAGEQYHIIQSDLRSDAL